MPKVDELRVLCSKVLPELVFCTETWLHNSISDSLITISGYNLLRFDREIKRGGGVCVYYSNDTKITKLQITNIHFSIEIMFYFTKYYICVDVHSSKQW